MILVAGFFLYERLRGGVDVAIKLPDKEVQLGMPFEIELTLANNSANALKNVRLELELPGNLILADKPDEKIISRGIGDMVNGRLERETFKVIAVPGENPNYKIRSTVYYVPASISANLQRKKEVEVRVKNPDVSLELNAPERIFGGEEFEVKANYKNGLAPKNGNYQMELKINYPPDFNVLNRDPTPKGENNNWRLEEVGLREGTAILKGSMELPDDANFSIAAELVMRILGKEYPVISATRNVTVNPSPLAFRIGLGSAKEVVEPGEELTYFLQYKNNADVPLEDVVISVGLTGEMFDMSTLQTSGAADLLANTLLWSPAQIKALEILEPGEEGQVSFVIKVKNDYPVQKQGKNFILKVDARIESPTAPPSLNISKTVNFGTMETKIAGKLTLEASAYFRDTAAKIVNSGSLPPKVGWPTAFTVHWSLSNAATDLGSVEVRAKLENGVSFTGKVKSNTDALPQFDSATREITWRLEKVPANKGIIDAKSEAVFQIEAVPSTSMTGQYMPLLGTTELKAKDEFTGAELRVNAPPLTTRLEKDPTVHPADGLVRQ